MPQRGRPRLTEEEFSGRRDEYCTRYQVAALPSGLPPFPAGHRETPQHREWIAIYKAHHRLARRGRGQCERCAAPAAPGSVFCETHRSALPEDASDHAALAGRQSGRCPVCSRRLDLAEVAVHGRQDGTRTALHPRCQWLVSLAESLGPEALERVRGYLWSSPSTR